MSFFQKVSFSFYWGGAGSLGVSVGMCMPMCMWLPADASRVCLEAEIRIRGSF